MHPSAYSVTLRLQAHELYRQPQNLVGNARGTIALVPGYLEHEDNERVDEMPDKCQRHRE